MNKTSRSVVGLALTLLAATQALAISETFKRVKESVVVLETSEKALSPARGSRELVKVGGLGSGVLVDKSGLILTAAHVVQAAEEIKVHFADGTVQMATVYASEPSADIAVIKLNEPPTSGIVAPLGDSDKVEVGDEIFIVGAPLGITYTLTVGHISARRRANQLWGGFSSAELFQTDAAINHGNSGGPMFNTDGEVIGIVSSMISQSGGYEGLGFVVTSNVARRLVLENRAVWSGMEGYMLEGRLAQIFNVPQAMGILVQRVAANSPAARMGLHPGTLRATIEDEEIIIGGDIVLAVQGIALTDGESFGKIRSTVNQLEPGAELTITVLRDGAQIELSGVLIEQ